MSRKTVPVTVLLDSRDVRRLARWAEARELTVESMLMRLIADERKRREGK